MKLFNQFTILKENLSDLDYEQKNKFDYCIKKFEEHPTNQNYLVYCDWQVMTPFHNAINSV